MVPAKSSATAFLTCQCGQCRVTPCDPNMRYRLECLCFDCRHRGLQFASRRAENRLAPAIVDYERGVDDYYTDHEEPVAFPKVVTGPLADACTLDGYVTFEPRCAGKPIVIDNSYFAESRQGAG